VNRRERTLPLPSGRPSRYTGTAIAFHWLIALGIAGTFSLGLYMHELPLSPDKLRLYSWHKWVGLSLFLLVLLRLAWRGLNAPSELPAAMPGWQRVVAQWSHYLLYVLMFAVPLSDWLMSSAKGFQTVCFGLWPIPDLLAKNKDLGEQLALAYKGLTFFLAFVVTGHVLAALKHHYLNRDDVLVRMLPGRRPAHPSPTEQT
jgi:cytochrome b561